MKKLWQFRWALRSLLQSIWFNFHYLPFSQAVRLPILLYKPKLLSCKGKVRIEGKVVPGMVRLGQMQVSLCPNDGIVFENHGGTLVFKGLCIIGNHSFVSVGEYGELSFGADFKAVAIQLACYRSITFGERVRIGWNCQVTDTDFHKLKVVAEDGTVSDAKGTAEVRFGDNVWMASHCLVQKGTSLPAYTVVAAGSLVNRHYDIPEKSLLAGRPAVCKRTGFYRDLTDDVIEYGG